MWRAVALLGLLVAGCATAPASPLSTRDPDSPYALSRQDYLVRVKGCLADRGFVVTIDVAEGSIQFDGSSPAQAEFNVALDACMLAMDPTRVEAIPSPHPEQFHAWYLYLVDKAACLKAAGVQPAEVPPETVFIESGGAWDPLNDIYQSGGSISEGIRTRCERLPSRPAFLDW